MLATIRDDTWNVLNMQHITSNLKKKWDYSDIPSGGHKRLKEPATWLKVATTLELELELELENDLLVLEYILHYKSTIQGIHQWQNDIEMHYFIITFLNTHIFSCLETLLWWVYIATEGPPQNQGFVKNYYQACKCLVM